MVFSEATLYKIRKFKSGVKVTNPRTKESNYYEINNSYNQDIILKYPIDEKGNIGQVSGEIVLWDFIENMEKTHELLNM